MVHRASSPKHCRESTPVAGQIIFAQNSQLQLSDFHGLTSDERLHAPFYRDEILQVLC